MKTMIRIIDIQNREPELNKWVVTFDTDGQPFVYRRTEHGWNMRDMPGSNTPNDNLPIVSWLEKVNTKAEVEKMSDSEIIDLLLQDWQEMKKHFPKENPRSFFDGQQPLVLRAVAESLCHDY